MTLKRKCFDFSAVIMNPLCLSLTWQVNICVEPMAEALFSFAPIKDQQMSFEHSLNLFAAYRSNNATQAVYISEHLYVCLMDCDCCVHVMNESCCSSFEMSDSCLFLSYNGVCDDVTQDPTVVGWVETKPGR